MNNQTSSNQKLGIFAILLSILILLGIGIYVFYPQKPQISGPTNQVDRYKVELGNAPKRGSQKPKVFIVEFSDYECGYCRKAENTLQELLKKYPDLAIYHRHNPLPFHPNATTAAKATLAAKEQGIDKFWALHTLLFDPKNTGKLSSENLENYAKSIGLDVEKWKKDLVSNNARYETEIKEDQALSAKLGTTGTPAFFINGRPLLGNYPIEDFIRIIDEELAQANQLLSQKVPHDELYAILTQEAKESIALKKLTPKVVSQKTITDLPDDKNTYRVEIGNSPAIGPADAKVTIVEFANPRCKFCLKLHPILQKTMQKYPKDIRLVYKHFPTTEEGKNASLALIAAHKQGKFEALRELLYNAPPEISNFSNEQLIDFAKTANLNIPQFVSDLKSSDSAQILNKDMALLKKVSYRPGTPTFFINGKLYLGGLKVEVILSQIVEKSIKEADELIQKNKITPAELYAFIEKTGKTKSEGSPTSEMSPGKDSSVIYKVDIGNSPFKGASQPKVTIVEFSDFECPFCKKVLPTLDEILKENPDVRLVFKQNPLTSIHENAGLAAQASLAAHAQGKFWEMHDKLFENPKALDVTSLNKYAKEIGLNTKRFQQDLTNESYRKAVEGDLAQAMSLRVTGTPAFYINGLFLKGAAPKETFLTIIKAARERAEVELKKGIKPKDLYSQLMVNAVVPKSMDQEYEEQAKKILDSEVVSITAGDGPSFGKPDAPITIVEFSDFQCPHCSKGAEIVKKIKEKHPGNVRFVWRNFPLPFHQEAKPAAKAALAAHRQGKFWEMHDILFRNQRQLSTENYKNYAQQIGIDATRFAKDLEDPAIAKQIDADFQYGQTVSNQMGTPTFFLNGHRIDGALPFEIFDKVIDGLMKKKSPK